MGDERPDGTPAEAPIAEAAERLGISTEAARKRVQRGTLPGRKVDGSWFVAASALPPSAPTGRQDGRPDAAAGRRDGEPVAAGQRSDDDPDGVRPPPEPAPSVDLRPLADVIERQGEEIRRLAEAATVWQLRAVQAEERLKALGTGDAVGPPASTGQSGQLDARAAKAPAPWWRRVWWLRDRDRD